MMFKGCSIFQTLSLSFWRIEHPGSYTARDEKGAESHASTRHHLEYFLFFECIHASGVTTSLWPEPLRERGATQWHL